MIYTHGYFEEEDSTGGQGEGSWEDRAQKGYTNLVPRSHSVLLPWPWEIWVRDKGYTEGEKKEWKVWVLKGWKEEEIGGNYATKYAWYFAMAIGKVYINGGNQEKRGRSRECKVQKGGGLEPPIPQKYLRAIYYLSYSYSPSSRFPPSPAPAPSPKP